MVPAPSQNPAGNDTAPLQAVGLEPLSHEREAGRSPEDVGVGVHELGENALEEGRKPS